ncbi:Conserved_hypothetical protein [Hexamita inflata]|uniref:Uncharacterized protein n=1 Tax=Hexamita inflata TaxID=28002 RepID=A0AA86UTR3_9EUKA|nr:Conserved hypothetical protein [Hexamita inflata]
MTLRPGVNHYPKPVKLLIDAHDFIRTADPNDTENPVAVRRAFETLGCYFDKKARNLQSQLTMVVPTKRVEIISLKPPPVKLGELATIPVRVEGKRTLIQFIEESQFVLDIQTISDQVLEYIYAPDLVQLFGQLQPELIFNVTLQQPTFGEQFVNEIHKVSVRTKNEEKKRDLSIMDSDSIQLNISFNPFVKQIAVQNQISQTFLSTPVPELNLKQTQKQIQALKITVQKEDRKQLQFNHEPKTNAKQIQTERETAISLVFNSFQTLFSTQTAFTQKQVQKCQFEKVFGANYVTGPKYDILTTGPGMRQEIINQGLQKQRMNSQQKCKAEINQDGVVKVGVQLKKKEVINAPEEVKTQMVFVRMEQHLTQNSVSYTNNIIVQYPKNPLPKYPLNNEIIHPSGKPLKEDQEQKDNLQKILIAKLDYVEKKQLENEAKIKPRISFFYKIEKYNNIIRFLGIEKLDFDPRRNYHGQKIQDVIKQCILECWEFQKTGEQLYENQVTFNNPKNYIVQYMIDAENEFIEVVKQANYIELVVMISKYIDQIRKRVDIKLLDLEIIKRSLEKIINMCLEKSIAQQNILIQRYNQLQDIATLQALKKCDQILYWIEEEKQYQEHIQSITNCEEIFDLYEQVHEKVYELDL